MSESKPCRVCGAEKPLTEFHARRDTGMLRGECKACRCSHQQQYAKTGGGRATQQRADKIRHQRFPFRRYARSTLYHAIERGAVRPQPCHLCGGDAEAHHPDYSRPLDVVWLCASHHKEVHRHG